MNISFAAQDTDKCDDCVFYSNAGKDNVDLGVEWENHKKELTRHANFIEKTRAVCDLQTLLSLQ
jgi:hypothetical protein